MLLLSQRATACSRATSWCARCGALRQANPARTVDNFVAQLRVKVEADPERPTHLLTVRGSGYRFVR